MKKFHKDTFIRRQIFLDDFADFPLRYGGWAISEDYAYDLVQYAMIHRPKVVLDLGTGTTTALLGKVAEELKKVGHNMKVISVDSDEKWLADTKKILEAMKVDEFVDLVYAPITETEKGKYYDPQKVFTALEGNKIDLMTIDGPPGSTQKEARYPAMPFFEKFLSNEAVIFLDDGAREEEQAITERWKKEFPEWVFEYKDYMKGGFVAYKKAEYQINPIISNHSNIVDYNEKKEDEIILNMEKFFKKVDEFGKQLEIKDKELIQKTQQLETKDKELIQKTQQLETKERELIQERNKINKFLERIKNLETSKSYRLGSLFFRSIKNPWKMITFLVNFLGILLKKEVIEEKKFIDSVTVGKNSGKIIKKKLIKNKKIAIKIPVPDWESAYQWGDYHFALALKKYFEKEGWECLIQIYPDWDDSDLDYDCSVVLVLRGGEAL